MEWLMENGATLLVGGLLLLAVLGAVRSLIRDHKRGGCACGCTGCSCAGGSCAGGCTQAGKGERKT